MLRCFHHQHSAAGRLLWCGAGIQGLARLELVKAGCQFLLASGHGWFGERSLLACISSDCCVCRPLSLCPLGFRELALEVCQQPRERHSSPVAVRKSEPHCVAFVRGVSGLFELASFRAIVCGSRTYLPVPVCGACRCFRAAMAYICPSPGLPEVIADLGNRRYYYRQ